MLPLAASGDHQHQRPQRGAVRVGDRGYHLHVRQSGPQGAYHEGLGVMGRTRHQPPPIVPSTRSRTWFRDCLMPASLVPACT